MFVFAFCGVWPCGHLLTDLLVALLCLTFSCVFVTFPYGVLGQVWNWIVWIPNLSLLSYFVNNPVSFISKIRLFSLLGSLNQCIKSLVH